MIQVISGLPLDYCAPVGAYGASAPVGEAGVCCLFRHLPRYYGGANNGSKGYGLY